MLFATDLDNTIIHSYKVAQDLDICVEKKDDKSLSFMSPESYNLLKEVSKKCMLVPITTRSLEQYNRINLRVFSPLALVANGALLLINNNIDKTWLEESKSIIKTPLPKIYENKFIYDIRYVDEFFIFAKTNNPEYAVEFLQEKNPSKELFICAVHNKVYVFPKNLNKGSALERLKKRLNPEIVFCAGDSVLDIPMLKIADKAFSPKSLGYLGENSIVYDDKNFAYNLLCFIKNYKV